MRILCAPDSFKESITAKEAAAAMAEGVRRALPEAVIDLCPIADGGEGTVDVILAAAGGVLHTAEVMGPLGERMEASFGIINATAIGIIELAQASGLALVPREKRDPTRTTTYGTGELVQHASERGCQEVIVFLGGSATVDGGAGIAQALGTVFLDEAGAMIRDAMTGGLLRKVSHVAAPNVALLPKIRMACDVTNPLCGPNGAAAVYGPQKGANPEQVRQLDGALERLAVLLRADAATPGFGAAGGAALTPVMLLGATMERGIDLVFDVLRFEDRCQQLDLVLTGEGSLDAQSLSGKATISAAKVAAKSGIPTVAVVGRAGDGAESCVGPGLLASYISLTERFGEAASLHDTARCIAAVTQEVAERRSAG